jgi:tetratricopeptide (TPR) repeat protein
MGKAPEHHQLSDYEVLMRVLDRVKAFIQKNGLHALLVILVLAIAVILYRTHLLRQQARGYGTWELLGRIEDPSFLYLQAAADAENVRTEDLKSIEDAIKSPGDAKARPWLLMKKASLLASGGRWDEAIAAYEQVARRYPKTAPLADAARASVLEGAGRYADAAALDEGLAPGSPARWVDAGRCREFAGDLNGAKSDYDRALAEDIDDTLRGFATARLAELARGQLLPPPPAPVKAPSQVPSPIVPADTSVGP